MVTRVIFILGPWTFYNKIIDVISFSDKSNTSIPQFRYEIITKINFFGHLLYTKTAPISLIPDRYKKFWDTLFWYRNLQYL